MQILALKNLGLNIRRAKIRPDDVKNRLNKFFITDARTAEKITKSKRLEDIRMTILENLLHYHPDAAEDLGIGPKAKRPSSRDYLHPLGPKARSESYAPITLLRCLLPSSPFTRRSKNRKWVAFPSQFTLQFGSVFTGQLLFTTLKTACCHMSRETRRTYTTKDPAAIMVRKARRAQFAHLRSCWKNRVLQDQIRICVTRGLVVC